MITLQINTATQSQQRYSFQTLQALAQFLVDQGALTELVFVDESSLTEDQQEDLSAVRKQKVSLFRSI